MPSSGPDLDQVVGASRGPRPEFRVVNLNTAPETQVLANASPEVEPPSVITQAAKLSSVDLIDVGDVLQVTVFEVGASLFSGTANANSLAGPTTPTANAEALPVMPVGPDGSIQLPYVGRITAAGRSPTEVAADIEAGLRGKSQSPQVVVTVHEDQGNTVVLIGDVKSPGRKPLSYRRESLLDMVAMAGGPTFPSADTTVRLTRNGRSAEMQLGEIHSGSNEDVTLQSHDRLELIYRQRTFTAFGATGKVSEIPLQSLHLTLAQALARMGGPLDQQADPRGIFIFRARQSSGALPIVYRLDLKNPNGYFVAQQFQVLDHDLIYVANAKSNAWYKFLSLINIIVSPVVTAKYLGS